MTHVHCTDPESNMLVAQHCTDLVARPASGQTALVDLVFIVLPDAMDM